jgi:hypothetical protein
MRWPEVCARRCGMSACLALQESKAYISLRVIPVLREYVKNYGDRRGRLVIRAKGYAPVPAADAVLGATLTIQAHRATQ